MANETLHFSVDSQLLGELGERLVTKKYVALAELVKNSYDADATKAVVRLVQAGKGGSPDNEALIEIVDDGLGMSQVEVREHWMRIATAIKRREPLSTHFGRPKAGNKGIGRFACQRLARRLELSSTARIGRDTFQTTTVTFNWDDFAPGSDVAEIPCLAQTTVGSSGNTGVTLRLRDLRDIWTQRDFDALRRQLVALSVVSDARRKGYAYDPGFTIELDAPEFQRGTGLLSDQSINAGWGTLRARVDRQGHAHLTLDAKLIGRKEYRLPESYEDLAGVRFTIAHLPAVKEFFRDPTTLTKGLQEELSLMGGVRVYLNGFRVYPYGERGDDWLGLDRDVARRLGKPDEIFSAAIARLNLEPGSSLLDLPRNVQLIGKVLIDSANVPSLEVKMDREGFIESATYRNLVRLIRLSIEWMTLNYTAFRRRFAARSVEHAGERLAEASGVGDAARLSTIDAAVDILQGLAQHGSDSPAKSREISRRAAEVIEENVELLNAEMSILRGLASTGPVMFAFAHELRTVGARLDLHAATLDRLAKQLGATVRGDFEEAAEDFRATRQRLDEQMKLFGVFAKAQQSTARRMYLRRAIDDVHRGFRFLLADFGITLDYDRVPSDLKVGPIRDAELFSILINLLSNAIKAVIAGKGERIRIAATGPGPTVIRVLDDGVGLKSSLREEVFRPLTADPEDRIYSRLGEAIHDSFTASLGRGTGLGLSIVRGIVSAHAGTVKFVDAPKGWKTCIEVRLP